MKTLLLIASTIALACPVVQKVQMNVSAYCPCVKCCGADSDGRTATNYKIKQGDRFVAAPKPAGLKKRLVVVFNPNRMKNSINSYFGFTPDAAHTDIVGFGVDNTADIDLERFYIDKKVI